jgi:DNA polymerase-3 subunit delta
MARQSPTFYVFHGDDEYSIKVQVDDMRQKMGDDLNITEFDGTKATASEVISAAQALPFLSDRRLVLVYGMLEYLSRRGASEASKDDLKKLVAALVTLPSSARLIFVESKTLSAKHAVIKLIHEDPSGYEKAFNPPKNPISWIQKQAQVYNVTIQPQAASALAGVIDTDLRKADNELVKLAAYVGDGGTITEKEVTLLTSYVAESSVWDMVDSLGKRDGNQAMEQLHRLLDVDRQEPMQLFGMVIRQFRLLIQAREVMDEGGNANSIATELNVHSFVGKKLHGQARGFSSIGQLESIYRHLLDTDFKVKTGQVEILVALDLLVAGLTGG